jgi:hypothetical protein
MQLHCCCSNPNPIVRHPPLLPRVQPARKYEAQKQDREDPPCSIDKLTAGIGEETGMHAKDEVDGKSVIVELSPQFFVFP